MKKPLVAITGASSGIGKAIAYLFANQGYPLLLMARRVEVLDSFTEIKDKITRKVDVTNFEEIKQAVSDAEEIYGPVDLLINNAGIMPLGSYLSQPLKEKHDIIDVDLKGVINGMDVVLSGMVNRQKGTIINMSSVASRYASLDHSLYNGAKAAVNMITQQARIENAQNNIRFTLIEPGFVNTELSKTTTNNDALDIYQKQFKAINGGLDPEEIAKIVLYVYELPQEVNIKEIMVTKTNQAV